MSKKMLTVLTLAGVLAFLAGLSWAQENKQDTELVNKTLKQYFEAFNKHDTSLAMNFWARDAEYSSPGGKKIKGRDALKKRLDSFFKEHGSVKASFLNEPKIMIISPTKAVARGVIRNQVSDKVSNDVEYTAIFSKDSEQWKILHMDDKHLASFEAYEKLSELAWLLGEWIDLEGADVIDTKFEWAPNKSFITGHFRINIDGNVAFEGNQVIGWDPLSKQLKSWVFDSEGGVGHGVWTKESSGWAVNMSSTLADGRKASAINTYRPLGPDRLAWKSTGREVAGAPLPNLEETIVVRNFDQKKK